MKTPDGHFVPDRIKYYILANLDETGKRRTEKSVNSMTKKEIMDLFEVLTKEDIENN